MRASKTKRYSDISVIGEELDPVDRRILRALQADGRLSNAALAERVHLSPAACWARTRRLFERGVIRAVRALIDPKALQQETVVLVGVVLDRSTRELRRVRERGAPAAAGAGVLSGRGRGRLLPQGAGARSRGVQSLPRRD